MDLGGFWKGNGAKLAPKWGQKSILALKRKNQLNTSPLVPNWVRRVQVESKNRSKIEQKTQAKREAIGASIFDRFWWIWEAKLGQKIDQKSIKKGIEKTMQKRRAPRRPRRGLGRFCRIKNGGTPVARAWHGRGTGAGAQTLLLRIPYDFPKEKRKEK